MQMLLIKTFSETPGISYKEASIRPAIGMRNVAIGSILVFMTLVYQYAPAGAFWSLLISTAPSFLITAAIVAAVSILVGWRLTPTIEAAIAEKNEICRTPLSFTGEKKFKKWATGGSLLGVLIGLQLAKFSHDGGEIALAAPVFGAIFGMLGGLSGLYIFWEKKYKRVIRLARYTFPEKKIKPWGMKKRLLIIIAIFTAIFLFRYFAYGLIF